MIKLVVHSLLLAGFLHTWYLDYKHLPDSALLIPGQPLSRLGWLTMVDMVLHTVYHFVAILIVLFGFEKSCNRFKFLGQVIVGPVGVAVAVLFWGLWTFDPHTLAKDATAMKLVEIRPWNHGLHTLPALSAFLDVVIWKRPNPKCSCAFKTIFGFVLIYIGDIYLINYLSGGNWPYPILAQLDTKERIVFYAFAILIVLGCYGSLALFNRIIHGEQKEEERKTKKQQKKKQ
ncbi:hypothetical protein PRIPAC_70394 [Pristionchus pacificus]|uniref:Uncharacterized protein n=1 Tax=Pristionchus pacificus TaxID=54126 RepID=A0A2A6D093_PRIPA|nr:hypothetical protein PRIPAC_70394 [Pristionchus pacificus]|eukprot:PDM83819.1 hypothetical protein PRIPAC_30306 [Pristionchus pacificus]